MRLISFLEVLIGRTMNVGSRTKEYNSNLLISDRLSLISRACVSRGDREGSDQVGSGRIIDERWR